ncbi:MAG: tRNA 2-thiouridine synthesizing protein D [Glaciecola sp.]|jgi:tRNA 2-thiouridine synthesizing protein D
MNKFLIFITGSPFDSLNGQTALSFCESAVSMGHCIEQIFFYQQGVQHANIDIQAASGELGIMKKWVSFSEQTKTPLNICVTAAIKRGVIAMEEAQELELNSNLHASFNSVGMADYFAALNNENSGDVNAPICIQF